MLEYSQPKNIITAYVYNLSQIINAIFHRPSMQQLHLVPGRTLHPYMRILQLGSEGA